MTRSSYEIDIVKETGRQQVLRRQGFKFCPNCGRDHLVKHLVKHMKSTKGMDSITLTCDCGGEIVVRDAEPKTKIKSNS